MANLKKIYHNGTAYNIPVTSVNNSTGDVTVQETLVSGTNIKTINNTSLLGSGNIDIQSGGNYTAGEGIEIKNGPDYSAMQGPAPDGFHVPSKDEWVALCGILTTTFSKASNATTMGTYLKMPMAGNRYYINGGAVNHGSYGYYWSSTPYNASSSYYLRFNSSEINPQGWTGRANGYAVRCFKDNPTIPASSWTTLYQGTGSAGVFWNSTEGLISVSGDGQIWYTIQDKNLGATTVFNQGDTLTDANCGNFYQWGNNYGFPHSGTVTTSSTRVDASNYGPGNYYSSSTFITRSSSPYDWSSVQSDNLWGGVTGVISNAISNTGVLSVNGQTGDVTVDSGITKIFTLSSTSDLTNAQAAYNRLADGKNPVIRVGATKTSYNVATVASNEVYFSYAKGYGAPSGGVGDWSTIHCIHFTISSGTVTAVEQLTNKIQLASSAPSSGANNIITFVI